MSALSVGLSPEAFAQVFPFHFAFGPDLRIVQVGSALERGYPEIQVGGKLQDYVRIQRPYIVVSFDAIRRQQRTLFILEPIKGGLLLRGQMLVLPEKELMVFLGAPWITSMSDLAQMGLSLNDFAVHDPIGDLLTLLQARQTARIEAEQLATRITEHRSKLQRANQELEARLIQIQGAKKTLLTNTSRLTALISSLQAGVLVEDQDGQVVLANQAFCTIFDIPVDPEVLIGANCKQAAQDQKVYFADPEGFLTRVDQILDEQRIIVGEEIQMADGRILERDYIPIWIETTYGGHLWQYRNITSRKLAEHDLARARDEALASSRLKSEFLAMVSHEIRTPMNGVIGMTELLMETSLSGDQREIATTITEASHALLTIINDILDYSKIEAGKLSLDRAPLSPIDLIGGITSMLGPQARAQGLSLVSEVSSDIPAMIYGDVGRLRQVLLNLVGNAIKFTPAGKVIVCAEPIASNGQQVTLRIAISDTGIGIPAEAQSRLFQPFSQVDGSMTRQYSGTGLGLAISKSLIELMGGTIGFSSIEGQGSTFWFEVTFVEAPLLQKATSPRRMLNQFPPTIQGIQIRILLVEDLLVNQRLVIRQLSRLGYSVDVASNGREALDILNDNATDYALVLMDCQMPEMDGYTATQAIRASEQSPYAHIPIIAMTASALQSDREACLSAGMDDVLTKPVSRHTLQETIERWLNSYSEEALLTGEPADELEMLREEDPESFTILVENYITEQRHLIDDLWVALSAADTKRLMRAAHSLRGSSAAMGALVLVQCCTEIETIAREGTITHVTPLLREVQYLGERVCAALIEKASGVVLATPIANLPTTTSWRTT